MLLMSPVGKRLNRIIVRVSCLAIFWAGISMEARCDAFAYADPESGVLHLTDNPANKNYQVLLRASAYTPVSGEEAGNLSYGFVEKAGTAKALQRAKVQEFLVTASSETGVEFELLDAVIRTESNYNPVAVSRKGARGLMQLMPETARRFGVSDIGDPQQNIQGGARYLAYLLDIFNRNLGLALAAYNAGENAVIRYGYRVPPFAETQGYIKKVLAHYNQNKRQSTTFLQ